MASTPSAVAPRSTSASRTSALVGSPGCELASQAGRWLRPPTASTLPADPIDRMEPADPMDAIDPADPIDAMLPTDPRLAIDPADSADHADSSDWCDRIDIAEK